MKTVTNIEDFITSLKEMENGSGDWIIYPEIAGYESRAKLINGTFVIRDKTYNFKRYFEERNISLIDGIVNVLVAPKNYSAWIDTDNLFIVDMQVKTMMDKDLDQIIEDCYLFTTDKSSNIPTIPYYNEFKTLYELLDNLNKLDRNLRMSDWINLGLTIKRGKQRLLYIKPPTEAITTIKEISYKISRTGVIIPIAKFEPVSFNGTLTLQATLHNSNVLIENGLKVNDIVTIKVKRQGHYSAEVISVLYPYNNTDKLVTISKCPSCNSNLIKKKRGNFLICINSLCKEKLVKKLLYWCSTECMNIKGLGIRFIEYLVENKIVTTIDDIYVLQKTDLMKAPGILDKMADNIIAQIEASRKRPLINVFLGLGIDSIGKNASKVLAWHLMSVYNLMSLDKKEIKMLSIYLNEEQRDNLLDFLKVEINKEMLLNLSRHLNPSLPEIKTEGHVYYKKKFILKGAFSLLSREKIKNLLTRSGCIPLPTESKEYDHCLYNENRKIVYKIPKNKILKVSNLLLELIV